MSHKFKILSQLEKYYLSDDLSDISFIIDGNKVFAHKFLLSAESSVFKAMFFGDFKESNNKEIELKETSIEAFKLFLKYFYFEGFKLREDVYNGYLMAIEVFKLSHRFQMKQLSDVIEGELIQMISIDNIAIFCEIGLLYELNQLLEALKRFVAQNGEQIVVDKHFISESFETMSTILEILSAANFPQYLIISAVKEIIEKNSDKDMKSLKNSINFDLCTISDMKALREIHLFSESELLDKLEEKYQKYCQKVKDAFYSHSTQHVFLSRYRNNLCEKVDFNFEF
jgi:rRNA-processing protein FCF1